MFEALIPTTNANDLSAIWLTFELATLTTILLLLIGTPLSWWLAHTSSWFKPFIEAVVTLPLILPPTVLGFYLLVALGPHGIIGGAMIAITGQHLAFTFSGLVIGSMLYSMPFVVQPLQNAFESLGNRPLEVAATLRASPTDSFFSVVLPLSKRGFLTASTLGFAHTVGEFGVVLMIGGNIPQKTQVISIAIYDHVEVLQYEQAHFLSALMLIFSFVVMSIVYVLNRRWQQVPN
jgi:molybdate transport system permease protein